MDFLDGMRLMDRSQRTLPNLGDSIAYTGGLHCGHQNVGEHCLPANQHTHAKPHVQTVKLSLSFENDVLTMQTSIYLCVSSFSGIVARDEI